MPKSWMYKPEDERPVGIPMSYGDKSRQAGQLSPDEYMCTPCWNERREVVQPVVINDRFECVIHGENTPFIKKAMALSDFGYEQDYLERKEAMATKGSGTALQAWESPIMVPPEQARELQTRIITSLMGIRELGEMKSAAAAALAQMALAYNLNPFNQELWLLPVKKKSDSGKYEVVDFNLFVGYKGLLRSARRSAKENGSDFLFMENRMHILTPEEVVQRGAHLCTRCNGTGKTTFGANEYPCKKCAGKGKFDPSDIKAVLMPLVDLKQFETAKKVGLEGDTAIVTGVGIWQPGDNIADGRDPVWQATKRAQSDAVRKRYDLPFAMHLPVEEYSRKAKFMTDEGDIIEGEATVLSSKEPTPQEMADIVGIVYESDDVLDELIAAGINLGCETPADVLTALSDTGIREISQKNLAAILAEMDRQLNPQKYAKPESKPAKSAAEKKMPVGTEMADGKQGYAAQMALAELGIAQGKSQSELIKELYGDDAVWGKISVIELDNMVAFAKQAATSDPAARQQLITNCRKASEEGRAL